MEVLKYTNEYRPELILKDVKFKFRNFTGDPEKDFYGSDKKYCGIVIDDPDFANKLIEDGWKVKTKVYDDGSASHYLRVNVNYRDRRGNLFDEEKQPKVVVRQEGKRVRRELHEETVGSLDGMDILTADITITGARNKDNPDLITAYCAELWVLQKISVWEDMYAEEEAPYED